MSTAASKLLTLTPLPHPSRHPAAAADVAGAPAPVAATTHAAATTATTAGAVSPLGSRLLFLLHGA
jgi:hypothetical protein